MAASSQSCRPGEVTKHLTEEIVMGSNLQIIGKACLAPCIAVLLGCTLCASNAIAEQPARAETVKFEDLNVETSAGVQALYIRIREAAQRVCSQSDPVMKATAAKCARKAEAKTVEKMNLPSLTAYFRIKAGRYAEPLSAGR
jgi:UrcA family protein